MTKVEDQFDSDDVSDEQQYQQWLTRQTGLGFRNGMEQGMYGLITRSNFENPDDFYEALLSVHEGLNEAQSHALNARLVLLLANHIGKTSTLKEALILALESKEE